MLAMSDLFWTCVCTAAVVMVGIVSCVAVYCAVAFEHSDEDEAKNK